MIPALLLAAALDLHLDYTRHSLLGTYRHYTQYVNGAPVLDGEVIERDGTVIYSGVRASRPLSPGVSPGDVWIEGGGARRAAGAGETPALHPARRVIVRERAHEPVARYVDTETGEVVRETPLFFNAKARVFEINPVARLNAPQLRDANDAASAVPDAAYSIVDLDNLSASSLLAGPHVKIIDLQTPNTPHADASQSLMFDRGQPQFEEVNAYYAIDRSQKYLQSLGYVGLRGVALYAVPVDPHALGGDDNSLFESSIVPGQGVLLFGDGGTDDAEDPDIVLHEYTHAMQEWIAPGAFFGTSASESRALAEGIADYWAFSQNYAETVAAGRDPYCIADWDARCDGDDPSEQCGYPAGADCLRRVDSAKTMADFKAINRSGQEHENSAIWSSALREIMEALLRRHPADGRQTADRIVIESMFGIPNGPTYALMARNMVAAADALSPNDRDVVCSAMIARGVAVPDCVPRGEVTLFQSTTSQLLIDVAGQIERASLQIDGTGIFTLIAPDGTPVTDLTTLRGRSAAGTWTLQVQNGTLRSWTLVIQFAGVARLDVRPVSFTPRKHIAAVAHTAGELGTTWVSDVRVFNRGDKTVNVPVVYTPDGGGFAAVNVAVAPRQVVALNDIVFTTMRSTGLGALEIQGDVTNLVVTSRTYNTNARGTFGQFVPGANTADAIGGATHAFVTHMRDDADFRSNLGFTEVAGGAGVVRVNGQDINVAAFQHVQMPAAGSGDVVADFSVVSGSARILAYGSMIDNHSGDANYVSARVAPQIAQTLYAPAIDATGALGTHWRTEVVLANVVGGPVAGPVQYLDRGFVIDPAVSLLRFPDIVATLGREQTMGLLRFGPTAGILATARIYTNSDAGSFGQFVPFAAEGHGGDLLQLEVSDTFRTNLGAANLGAAPVVARFTMFDAAGNTLATAERVLQPLELAQFPLTVNAARVRVDGDVLAYASVVDNRSGDAIFVPAQ